MRRIGWPACLLLGSLSLLATSPSRAAGDAGAGNTLYHTTYKCTDCHAAVLTPSNPVRSGATVAGLQDALGAVAAMSQRYSFTLAARPADIADIAAYIASVTASAPAAPDLNQHGLTGSWYQPATDGQGIEVEVFPDASAPGTGFMQVSWFTFDTVVGGADRERWYTAGGPVVSGQPTATLTIYRNVGGVFNAPPVTTAVAVGTATVSFDSCASGRLVYAFSDGSARSGSIALTRLTQNVTCQATAARPTNADFAYSGNWYTPATSGQGVTVEVNPASSALFLAWYTYAPDGIGTGASVQRWYTGLASYVAGARTVTVELRETSGGAFDAPTVPPPATVAVGTGTLTFQSCSSATLSYVFTGGTNAGQAGTIALSRVGPVPPGCAA